MGKYAVNLQIKDESGSTYMYEADLKDMKHFSFEEYNMLLDVLNDTTTTIKEQYKQLLLLFTDIPWDLIENIKNVSEINFPEILKQEIKYKPDNKDFELKEEIKFKRIKKILIKLLLKTNKRFKPFKIKYILKNSYKLENFDNILIGKFIDLEYFLLKKDIDNNIERVCALLYIGNDYDMEKLNILTEDIHNNLDIGTALYLYNLFVEFRNKIYKAYSPLFKNTSDDLNEEDEEDIEVPFEDAEKYEREQKEREKRYAEPIENNIGLQSLVYFLANERFLDIEEISNKQLIKILNYCIWKKIENDKEIEKQKSNFLHH